jgi:L-aspartate oxidase
MPKTADSDVLIVGSGVSGLSAAVRLAELGVSSIVLTKDAVTEASSTYAQGGIATPMLPEDSVGQHVWDTLQVGQGLAEPLAVEHFVSRIGGCLEHMAKWQVPFASPDDLRLEGAHSHRRVLRVGKDITGRPLMKSLWERASREPRISISQGTALLELLAAPGGDCLGGRFLDINYNVFELRASLGVVLATGGYSSIYARSTNPFVSTGDGIACGYWLGAKVADMEFVQFHPTVLDHPSRFLLSEGLRGEGARLLDRDGNRLMASHDPERMELAPRSVVARAIWQCGEAWLDLRPVPEPKFPGIFSRCRRLGYDPTSQPLPVTPAAHYTIGGLQVNLRAETSVPGLYAIGEVARTGLHGADRLASNSLMEGIVGGFDVAEVLAGREGCLASQEQVGVSREVAGYDCSQRLEELYADMWRHAALARDPAKLRELAGSLSDPEVGVSRYYPSFNHWRQQLTVARLVTSAASSRPQSLGTHLIEALVG